MGTTTIIRREQRAVTTQDPDESLRLARGSEPMTQPRGDFGDDRPTSAINPLQLRGLIEQAGGLDAEIEVVAKRATTEPPAVIVSVPTVEPIQEVRPPVYPVYRGASARWLLLAAAGFAMLAVMLLVLR